MSKNNLAFYGFDRDNIGTGKKDDKGIDKILERSAVWYGSDAFLINTPEDAINFEQEALRRANNEDICIKMSIGRSSTKNIYRWVIF